MRQITVDLYQLDELDEAAQEAAHAEWMNCMGGYAEDVQNESWDQGRAIERFTKAIPWAHGSWIDMHGPGTEKWIFDPVDAFEAVDALDARPRSEYDWWDYGPREAFAAHMDAHAEELEAARKTMFAYSDYQSELEPGAPDLMVYDNLEAVTRIGDICDEALEAAARAINDDWQAMLEELQSFEHFADASAANEWEYTAAGHLA